MWTVNNPNGQNRSGEAAADPGGRTPGQTSGPSAKPPAKRRLHYLDHLRILLIVLVIVLHAAQPYGPADWWYFEGGGEAPLLAEGSQVGGAFLMSLFLFVSAYLVPAALDRRGGLGFLWERTRRFVPLILVGFLVIVPVLMYAYHLNFRDLPALGFGDYYADFYMGGAERPEQWTGPVWPDRQFAHLWFIQHLLVYALLYALWRWAAGRWFPASRPGDSGSAGSAGPAAVSRAPGTAVILAFTVILALATFLLRVWFPVDTWVPVLEFIQAEPADLALQTSFFVLGVLAYRRGWLASFGTVAGYAWLALGGALALLHLAAGPLLEGFYTDGGWNAGSLVWSSAESLMCVSISIGLLVLLRQWADRPVRFLAGAAALVFTVYVIHVPVVVALQYAAGALSLGPAAAFGTVSAAAVLGSFALAWPISRTPVLRRIL